MEKSLFEQMGGTYTQQGDYVFQISYYLPKISLLVYGDSATHGI